jgi:four helix bundle protein
MFGFENLEVWQEAIEFADVVYMVTRSFPDDERFGLVSQMRRCAVSISSNIAEGSGRKSGKDFARFVEFAYSSVLECVSQMHIAKRQQYLTNDDFDDLYRRANQLTRMLSGLRSSQLKST